MYNRNFLKIIENFITSKKDVKQLPMIIMVGGMFGWNMPVIHESGPMGILFSLFVVVIAALNLVLDFDFIERGHGVAPRYMEWYAAFGLVVTLAWLYLELLRLLSKLRER